VDSPLPARTIEAITTKWHVNRLKERSAYQTHFDDLCAIAGHPTPSEADPIGAWFCVEAPCKKRNGGSGRVDIWKAGSFVVSYKTSGADLDRAYNELLDYQEFPDGSSNLPLLVVCDFSQIVIHTNFNSSAHRIIVLTMESLLTKWGQSTLRAMFFCPEYFRNPLPPPDPESPAEDAVERFTRIIAMLTQAQHDRTTESGWTIARLKGAVIAYKKAGEVHWRVATGSRLFKERIGKSAVQRYGVVWARRGWIELKRGATSSVQGVAGGAQMRCICVPDHVLNTWGRE